MKRLIAAAACSLLALAVWIGPASAELLALAGPLAELDGRYLIMDKARGAVELRGEGLAALVGKRVWVSGDLEESEKGVPVLTVDEIEVIQAE